MKRMLLTVVLCGLVLSAVTASEAGRSLTDQELWQVRGADTGCVGMSEWCIVDAVPECVSHSSETPCLNGFEENSGGGPWWNCFGPQPGYSCSATAEDHVCKTHRPCMWTSTGFDSGMNPIGTCSLNTSESFLTEKRGLHADEITGNPCPQ